MKKVVKPVKKTAPAKKVVTPVKKTAPVKKAAPAKKVVAPVKKVEVKKVKPTPAVINWGDRDTTRVANEVAADRTTRATYNGR